MNKLIKKLSCLAFGLVLSLGVGVSLTSNDIRKEIVGVDAEEPKKVTWTASNANNFYGNLLDIKGLIGSVNGTCIGTIKTGSFEWGFKRTLTALATNKKDNANWNDAPKGLNSYYQFGSNDALESLELTTSAFSEYTIKSIVVDCASKKGAHKLSFSIGGVKLLDGNTPVWDTDKYIGSEKSLSCSTSGDITIAFTPDENTVNKNNRGALYIKSLSITYEEASTVTPDEEAETWGKNFMETDTALTCEDESADNFEDLSFMWSDFEEEYDKISDDAKNIVKTATADNNGSTYLAKAVARYDHIMNRYPSLNNFIQRATYSSGRTIATFDSNNNIAIMSVVIISFVGITVIGGYLFLKKQKQN